MGTKIPCILFVHITRKEHLKKYPKRNTARFPLQPLFFRARGRHTQKNGATFFLRENFFLLAWIFFFAQKKGKM